MRNIKLASLSLVVILAFGAMTAASASAFPHPLFVNQKGKLLLFSGTTNLVLLKALQIGGLDTIDCEKSSVHGIFANLSTLAHGVLFEFFGKCQLSGAIGAHCTEPILTKLLLGELGLASSVAHTVLWLLLAPNTAAEPNALFVKIDCELRDIILSGALVGEFPEIDRFFQNQYNKLKNEFELKFESVNNNTEQQKITTIFLLGTQMSGAELTASGFVEGKASVETTTVFLKPNGNGLTEITTIKE
jgi:hypothetical protein